MTKEKGERYILHGVEVVVIYFAIFSVIGWACEVVYCSILSKKLVNRGFLAGPVCPVYGFGALLVIWLLKPVSASIPIVFLSGIVVTSTLEYITGWLLEVLFSTRWWDYRNKKFNIDGRVCLQNSVFFGVLCVILMKVIFPFTVNIVALLPDLSIKLISSALAAAFIIDGIFTVNTFINLYERLKKLQELTEYLKKNTDIHGWFNESDFYKSFERLKLIAEESKNELNNKLREKFESLTAKKGSGIRLLKAFPNMKSINYNSQLNHLKEVLIELKQRTRIK